MNLLYTPELMSDRRAVSARLWIAPCLDWSISQDRSKCIVRRLDMLHVLELLSDCRAVPANTRIAPCSDWSISQDRSECSTCGPNLLHTPWTALALQHCDHQNVDCPRLGACHRHNTTRQTPAPLLQCSITSQDHREHGLPRPIWASLVRKPSGLKPLSPLLWRTPRVWGVFFCQAMFTRIISQRFSAAKCRAKWYFICCILSQYSNPISSMTTLWHITVDQQYVVIHADMSVSKHCKTPKKTPLRILNSSRTFMDFPHLGWVRCPPWSPYVLFHWAAGKSLGLHLGHRPPAHRCHRIPPKPGVSVHEMEIDPQPLTTIGKSWKVYGKSIWESMGKWGLEPRDFEAIGASCFQTDSCGYGSDRQKRKWINLKKPDSPKKAGMDWLNCHTSDN